MSTFHPAPIPWREFPVECFWYLAPMSVVHLAAFIIGIIVLAFWPRREPGMFTKRVGRFGLFVILFLLIGALFNGLWSCLVWGRIYDSTDYLFDFIPFWPITQRVIDAPWGDDHGHLIGITLFQLQLVWLAFAVGTWTTTILLFRFLIRKWPPNTALEPTAGSVFSSASRATPRVGGGSAFGR